MDRQTDCIQRGQLVTAGKIVCSTWIYLLNLCTQTILLLVALMSSSITDGYRFGTAGSILERWTSRRRKVTRVQRESKNVSPGVFSEVFFQRMRIFNKTCTHLLFIRLKFLINHLNNGHIMCDQLVNNFFDSYCVCFLSIFICKRFHFHYLFRLSPMCSISMYGLK